MGLEKDVAEEEEMMERARQRINGWGIRLSARPKAIR